MTLTSLTIGDNMTSSLSSGINNMMEITAGQMILIGVLAGLAMAGWLLGLFTATPLVYALLTGAALGDVKTALIVGASAQVLWLGFGMGTGGVRPPDPIAPGVLGSIIAIQMHSQEPDPDQLMSISEASSIVALTFAFGILVQFLLTALLSFLSPVATWAKDAAIKGQWVRFKLLSSSTVVVVFFVGMGLGIASAAGGQPLATSMREFPVWLKTSLKVVGGLLPALGFALILNVMLKKEYVPYLFVGYVLMVIIMVIGKSMNLNYSLMLLAVAALGIALIVVGIEEKIKKAATTGGGNAPKSKREAGPNGI